MREAEERRKALLSGLQPEIQDNIRKELIMLEESLPELNMSVHELYDQLLAYDSQGLNLEDLNRLTFNLSGFIKELMKKNPEKSFETVFYSIFQPGTVGGGKEMKRFGDVWEKVDKKDYSKIQNFLDWIHHDIRVRQPILDAYAKLKAEVYKDYSETMLPGLDHIIEKIRERYPVIPRKLEEGEELLGERVKEKEAERWKWEVNEIIESFLNEKTKIEERMGS